MHTATNFTFTPNPEEVIPDSIKGVLNVMESASREPAVKRFVLCSSSYAAILPKVMRRAAKILDSTGLYV